MANTNTVVNYPGVAEVAGMVISPNGGQVVYVGTSAQLATLATTGEAISSRSYTSVNAALAQCVTARGDYIYVLPGYTENITADAWSNLAATAVTVVGLGRGTNRPQFTWTAAGSTMLFDTANFRLQNCNLYMAGPLASVTALTVTAPITVSAAGCAIEDCFVQFGVDADQLVTIGVTTTAAADYFEFNRNTCFGDTAAECTTFLQLVGADWLRMYDTVIQGATSSTTVGVVRFLTTASLGVDVDRCTFQNYKASSVHAVTGMAGCTGSVKNSRFGILNDSLLVGYVTPSTQQFGCLVTNLAGENAGAMTPVST